MRLNGPAIVLFLGLAGAFAAGGRAHSAEGSPAAALSPPRGESARSYRDAVAGARLQTDIVYLAGNVPLDGEVEPPEEPRGDGTVSPTLRGASWAVLAAFAAAALLLLARHRHALAEIFGRGNRRIGDAAAGGEEEPAPREIDHDLLARLRAEPDPRVGLRLVLKRFLALAARENGVVLRRSLTTRELLRALPGGWRHRRELEALAGRVELVVFGGREIGREAYEECLDLAAPLLLRVEAA